MFLTKNSKFVLDKAIIIIIMIIIITIGITYFNR